MTDFNKNITYKIKSASELDVFQHLSLCSESFIPALSKKLNLDLYAKKIANYSITFEAWNNSTLIALVAAYFNNSHHLSGFITNVSVLETYKGTGLASNLLTNCINYAKEKNFRTIFIEVNRVNLGAIQLYKKYNFTKCGEKNDIDIMQYISK